MWAVIGLAVLCLPRDCSLADTSLFPPHFICKQQYRYWREEVNRLEQDYSTGQIQYNNLWAAKWHLRHWDLLWDLTVITTHWGNDWPLTVHEERTLDALRAYRALVGDDAYWSGWTPIPISPDWSK